MAELVCDEKENLIRSLSGQNFAIRTAKMDRLRINFGELLSQFVAQIKQFFCLVELFLPSCLGDNFS